MIFRKRGYSGEREKERMAIGKDRKKRKRLEEKRGSAKGGKRGGGPHNSIEERRKRGSKGLSS